MYVSILVDAVIVVLRPSRNNCNYVGLFTATRYTLYVPEQLQLKLIIVAGPKLEVGCRIGSELGHVRCFLFELEVVEAERNQRKLQFSKRMHIVKVSLCQPNLGSKSSYGEGFAGKEGQTGHFIEKWENRANPVIGIRDQDDNQQFLDDYMPTYLYRRIHSPRIGAVRAPRD